MFIVANISQNIKIDIQSILYFIYLSSYKGFINGLRLIIVVYFLLKLRLSYDGLFFDIFVIEPVLLPRQFFLFQEVFSLVLSNNSLHNILSCHNESILSLNLGKVLDLADFFL